MYVRQADRCHQRRKESSSRSLQRRRDSTGEHDLSFYVDHPKTDPWYRKMNTSPSTVDDKDALKKLLCNPPIKKIDLHFPLGLEVTARNLKGVTIKDALDAIHKQYKKKVSSSDGEANILL